MWENAFMDCHSLERVDIPEGTELSQETFYRCYKLSEVTIRGRRKNLYSNIFNVCPIRKLSLPDSYYSDLGEWVDRVLENISAKRGETVRLKFKDKTFTKTKLSDKIWR